MKLLRSSASGILIALVLAGCMGRKSGTPPGSAQMSKAEKPVAGIIWSYPSDWLPQHDLPMRVATYVIPSGMEDVDPGECAVFYFGKDQGGDVETNIERWGSQFEGAKQAEKTTKKIQGMDVTIVKIAGTYLAPGGPEMKSQGKMDNYKLIGAIVNAPEGMVFFKCTGPTAIIDRSETGFMSIVDSFEKE